MNDASAQLFAIALTATWCGFGLYGVVRKLRLSPQAREMLRRFRQARLSTKGSLVAGLVAVVAVGGTKPGGTNDPPRGMRPPAASHDVPARPEAASPAFAPVEVRMNNVALRAESASAVEVEDWRRHGSSSGGVWLDFGAPIFRIGTNPVSRAYVAANGAISFDSMHRPPAGYPLPDGTGLPALAPLLAPLGMVPEANWTNAGAASRFWHDTAPGRSRVLTWEEALLARQPCRRVSVQAELQPSGDFTYRYDFADALDSPATNLVIGAQVGTNGVNALSILGTNLLAETVWRVDGVRVTNGVSIADLLCTNGVLRTPARFAIEWKNTSGIDSNADADGDGLSDWDEVFLHGTEPARTDTDGDGLPDGDEDLAGANPVDADEDDDGVPDGFSPADWGAHPLWATNSVDGANIAVTLFRDIPQGEAATLLVGTLPLPLRSAGTRELRLPAGEAVPFRLFATRGAAPSLGLSPPASGILDPVFLDDPGGVFHVSRPLNRWDSPRSDPTQPPESRPGQGTLCVIVPRFFNADTLVEAPPDECVHDLDGTRRYRLKMAEGYVVEIAPDDVTPAPDPDGGYTLSVSGEPGDWDEAYAVFGENLIWGEANCSVRIHRCAAGRIEWCEACHLWHKSGEGCPHEEDCPTRTDPDGTCICPEIAFRVNSDEPARSFGFFPSSACCCPSGGGADFARILSVPSFAFLMASGHRVLPGGEVRGRADLYVYDTGGREELRYETVRQLKSETGVVTNETTRPGTLKLWGVDPVFEPVTTEEREGNIVNPCAVIRGETAVFKMTLNPANFPGSRIVWSAEPDGRVEFVNGENTGRQVEVRGLSAGFATLSARIAGYSGPGLELEIGVVEKQTVPVRAFIVGDGAEWATDEATVRGFLPTVNKIWRQAGIEFGPLTVERIENRNWFQLKEINYSWPAAEELCATAQNTGGVEWYFVKDIESEADAFDTEGGAVFSRRSTSRTIAHEMGHVLGLSDIYSKQSFRRPDGIVETVTVLGVPTRNRLESDWGSSGEEGYYAQHLTQYELVTRLIMNGTRSGLKGDVSAGPVDGIVRVDRWDPVLHRHVRSFELDESPIGFFSAPNFHPEHE